MPIVKSLMDSLVKRYGPERGKSVYYGMEGGAKGPFAPGGKYHDLHREFARKNGAPAVEGKKKPRPASHRKPGRVKGAGAKGRR